MRIWRQLRLLVGAPVVAGKCADIASALFALTIRFIERRPLRFLLGGSLALPFFWNCTPHFD
jgi:hypothetical protein